MTENSPVFAIDDTLGTAENLAVYAQALEAMDELLGAALGVRLAAWAAGQPADTAMTWDALYAAMMPADADPTPPGDGTGGEDGAV